MGLRIEKDLATGLSFIVSRVSSKISEALPDTATQSKAKLAECEKSAKDYIYGVRYRADTGSEDGSHANRLCLRALRSAIEDECGEDAGLDRMAKMMINIANFGKQSLHDKMDISLSFEILGQKAAANKDLDGATRTAEMHIRMILQEMERKEAARERAAHKTGAEVGAGGISR